MQFDTFFTLYGLHHEALNIILMAVLIIQKKSRIRHGPHPGTNLAGVPEKSAHSRSCLKGIAGRSISTLWRVGDCNRYMLKEDSVRDFSNGTMHGVTYIRADK